MAVDLTDYTSKTINQLLDLATFEGAASFGIGSARDARLVLKASQLAARQLKDERSILDEKALKHANWVAARTERFIESEPEGGFSYLHELCIVRLWSILEAGVCGVLRALLRNNASLPSQLRGAKVSLVEFLGADEFDRTEIMLRELQNATRSPLRAGIAKLESQIECFGLGGPVPADISKVLLECWQVRNVVVHCGGVVDRRFTVVCPWLQWVPGQRLAIQRSLYNTYHAAAVWYAYDLYVRTKRFGGVDPEPECAQVKKVYMRIVKRHLKRPADGQPATSRSASAGQRATRCRRTS